MTYSSLAAILRGVETFLTEKIPLTSREVGVRLRGRPPASGGQVYYGIYSTRFSHGPSNEQNWGLDAVYGFSVALTLRTGFIPEDRIPDAALFALDTGFDSRVHNLIYWLHVQRLPLLCYINNQLSPDAQPFVEPFTWTDSDAEPRWEGPDWFSADPNGPDNLKHYGLVLESRFTGGRRLQSLPSV